MNQSVFRPRTSFRKGQELLAVLQQIGQEATNARSNDQNRETGLLEAYRINSATRDFETVLAAEFGLTDIFLVAKKRGYDTTDLIDHGHVLFPEELATKFRRDC